MRILVSVLTARCLWTGWPSLACAQEDESLSPGWLVTSKALEAKIAEVQAAPDRTDQAKTQLIELYREALSNRQAAKDNTASAFTLRRRAERAPAEIQAIRAVLAADAQAEWMDGLDLAADTPLPVLE